MTPILRIPYDPPAPFSVQAQRDRRQRRYASLKPEWERRRRLDQTCEQFRDEDARECNEQNLTAFVFEPGDVKEPMDIFKAASLQWDETDQ